ncbi:MAG: hypothetical protein WCG75_06145 [Armatimonadota bacterium]
MFPPPEYLDANTTGMTSARVPTSTNKVMDPDAMQIGNLRLTDHDEVAIVAFLKCLSDGYFKR